MFGTCLTTALVKVIVRLVDVHIFGAKLLVEFALEQILHVDRIFHALMVLVMSRRTRVFVIRTVRLDGGQIGLLYEIKDLKGLRI